MEGSNSIGSPSLKNMSNDNEEHTENELIKEYMIANEKSKITLTPNPTTGKLQVTTNEHQKIVDIQLFDIIGKLILSHPSAPSPETVIDLSHLSNGIYFLKIQTENGTQTKKVIKNWKLKIEFNNWKRGC